MTSLCVPMVLKFCTVFISYNNIMMLWSRLLNLNYCWMNYIDINLKPGSGFHFFFHFTRLYMYKDSNYGHHIHSVVVVILISQEFYLLCWGSLPRFQCMDGSDQTAQWIDFKFADYVYLTPILVWKKQIFVTSKISMILKHFFSKFEIAMKPRFYEIRWSKSCLLPCIVSAINRGHVGADVMLLFYCTHPLVSGLQIVELRFFAPYFSQIFLNAYFFQQCFMPTNVYWWQALMRTR
jgi:hypothetical protein